MNREMEHKLIEVLDALETGEPVDAVLVRYSEQAADLRVHLMTMRTLSSLRTEPGHTAEDRSRQAFLARAEDLRRNAVVVLMRRSWLRRVPVFQMLTVVLLIIGCLVVGLASTRNALPGSPMYGAKLAMEQLQLDMASSAEERFALRQQQHQERIREIQTLLARGDEASISFTGEIRAITPDQWQVDELTVEITDFTLIEGEAVVGNTASVLARTEDGRLIASTIIVTGKLSIDETPQPDDTPAPTRTLRPTNTPVPPVVATPTIPFMPPTSTPTVPVAPTADNANENDNGDGGGDDDNANENENDNDDHGGSGGGGDD